MPEHPRRPAGKKRSSRLRRLSAKSRGGLVHRWPDLPRPESCDAKVLSAMFKGLARVFDHARLEVVRETHAAVGEHFLAMVERADPADLANAAEQRVLGLLWAELEEAIDRRAKRH